MMKKVHHVGILVDDFDHIVNKFEKFGLACTETLEISQLGLRIAFFPVGDTLIEFLQYRDAGMLDHLHRVVHSYEGTINHLCFEVDDLDASIRDFEGNGAKLVEGSPRAAGHGRIAFFYPETTGGVLIELIQVKA